MPDREPKKILFLDKVLTKPLKEDRLRGVEVFNVFFLKDLINAGHEVTLIIHPGWKATMARELPDKGNLKILFTSKFGGKNLGSLAPLWQIRKEKYDTLFLANVGDGILIPYRFIQFHKMVEKTVLLAHKVPGNYFVKSLKSDTVVVSINTRISKSFEAKGFAVMDVYYGILNTDQFYPPEHRPPDGTIRFGMLGDLSSDWKGSDTAIAAFKKLPSQVAGKAELHLAAYTKEKPEAEEDSRIFIYDWIDRDEVGDYLRSLDVMLCLSREIDGQMMETFCQAMVQGMLCGLPQITSDVDVLVEKLEDGGGITAENEAELVAAMVQLAMDPETRKRSSMAALKTSERYVWNSEYFIGKYL